MGHANALGDGITFGNQQEKQPGMGTVAEAFIIALPLGDDNVRLIKRAAEGGGNQVKLRSGGGAAVAEHGRNIIHAHFVSVRLDGVVQHRLSTNAINHLQGRVQPAQPANQQLVHAKLAAIIRQIQQRMGPGRGLPQPVGMIDG